MYWVQVHPRPYVYSQWGALQVRLRLWEKWLSHLWGNLHRLNHLVNVFIWTFPFQDPPLTQSTIPTTLTSNTLLLICAVFAGDFTSKCSFFSLVWLICFIILKCFFFFLICLRGAVTEANKDEQGCLGPKECKYVIMDRYNNYKKPEFSQQARRGSNYQLSVDNRLLQKTWRVHEQLWGLHSGMLLRPLSTSSPWGENYSFWRPRRRS